MKTQGPTTISITLNGGFKNYRSVIKRLLFILLTTLFSLPLLAQVKQEKEARIDKSELPSSVMALLPQI